MFIVRNTVKSTQEVSTIDSVNCNTVTLLSPRRTCNITVNETMLPLLKSNKPRLVNVLYISSVYDVLAVTAMCCRKAADQGHPHSAYNVAVGHLQGIRTDLLKPGCVQKYYAKVVSSVVIFTTKYTCDVLIVT